MAKPPAEKQKAKAEKKPKLTDAERHKRFVEVAREVEASDDSGDFDKVFEKIVRNAKRIDQYVFALQRFRLRH